MHDSLHDNTGPYLTTTLTVGFSSSEYEKFLTNIRMQTRPKVIQQKIKDTPKLYSYLLIELHKLIDNYKE